GSRQPLEHALDDRVPLVLIKNASSSVVLRVADLNTPDFSAKRVHARGGHFSGRKSKQIEELREIRVSGKRLALPRLAEELGDARDHQAVGRLALVHVKAQLEILATEGAETHKRDRLRFVDARPDTRAARAQLDVEILPRIPCVHMRARRG